MFDTMTKPSIEADRTGQRIMTRVWWLSLATTIGGGCAVGFGTGDAQPIGALVMLASLGFMAIAMIGEVFAACGMTRRRR